MCVLSYIRRKEAVGGWLMAFFCWAYAGLLVILLLSVPAVSVFFPATVNELSPKATALMFVVVLRLLGYVGTAVVSAFLLQTREWVWVKRLRLALGTQLLLTGISLILDRAYFPGSLLQNSVRWLVMCAWFGYFYFSTRVRMVFLTEHCG